MFNNERKMFNKQTITAFILGILVALFISHAYVVYQVRVVVAQNQAAIVEIVNFINQQSGQQAAPAVNAQ